MNMSALYGVRVARSSSQNGTMQGVLPFINQAGGNVIAVGGALTTTALNNALEDIFVDIVLHVKHKNWGTTFWQIPTMKLSLDVLSEDDKKKRD